MFYLVQAILKHGEEQLLSSLSYLGGTVPWGWGSWNFMATGFWKNHRETLGKMTYKWLLVHMNVSLLYIHVFSCIFPMGHPVEIGNL